MTKSPRAGPSTPLVTVDRTPRLWKKRLLATCVGLLLGLLIGEIAMRIAVAYSPEIRYLVYSGTADSGAVHYDLASFLETRASEHIRVHQEWRGYWTNSYGFYDREFTARSHERASDIRVMSLGDSFCYGLVPYNQNVQTLLEEHLCHDMAPANVEVFNLGIAAIGPDEYQHICDYAVPMLDPDIVVLHFYLGNDGPDIFAAEGDAVHPSKPPTAGSFLFSYVKNRWRIVNALEQAPSGNGRSSDRLTGSVLIGGTPVGDAHYLAANAHLWSGPFLTQDAHLDACATEAWRFCNTGGNEVKRWSHALDPIKAIHQVTERLSKALVVVLYPSRLQIDDALFEAAVAHARATNAADVERSDFDQRYPNRVLSGFCKREGIACYDLTPAFVAHREKSDEPVYFPRDTHWNSLGNAVAAAAEATMLKEFISKWRTE